MNCPIDEDKEPKRFGVLRDVRRARRQGQGRETRHLEDDVDLMAVIGFDPYPQMSQEENDVP